MKIMTSIVLVCALITSNALLAEVKEPPVKKRDFGEVKAKILKKVTVNIETLNTFKVCIQKAQTEQDLKVCQQQKFNSLKAVNKKAKKKKRLKPAADPGKDTLPDRK